MSGYEWVVIVVWLNSSQRDDEWTQLPDLSSSETIWGQVWADLRRFVKFRHEVVQGLSSPGCHCVKTLNLLAGTYWIYWVLYRIWRPRLIEQQQQLELSNKTSETESRVQSPHTKIKKKFKKLFENTRRQTVDASASYTTYPQYTPSTPHSYIPASYIICRALNY